MTLHMLGNNPGWKRQYYGQVRETYVVDTLTAFNTITNITLDDGMIGYYNSTERSKVLHNFTFFMLICVYSVLQCTTMY